jgi:hypothetical protein
VGGFGWSYGGANDAVVCGGRRYQSPPPLLRAGSRARV